MIEAKLHSSRQGPRVALRQKTLLGQPRSRLINLRPVLSLVAIHSAVTTHEIVEVIRTVGSAMRGSFVSAAAHGPTHGPLFGCDLRQSPYGAVR
jgi:hypothetical protein